MKDLPQGDKGVEEARPSGGEDRDLLRREDDAVGFIGHRLDMGDTAGAGIGKQRERAAEQPGGKILGRMEGSPCLAWPFHQRQGRSRIPRSHRLH